MKTNVLVTGANGQLAKTIKEMSLKYLDRITLTFTTKSELDITNKNNVEFFFNKSEYSYCINCAAYTNVEQSEKNPEIAFKVNAEAVKYLAQTCKTTDTILVHISTDYVFDGLKTNLILKKTKQTQLMNMVDLNYWESSILSKCLTNIL